MSGTLAGVRRRTRNLLRDLNPSAYAFKTPEVDSAINAAMTAVAGRLRLGQEWTSGAVTMVAGTDTYTMSGTARYGQVLQLRIAATGMTIEIVSRREYEALRFGVQATAGASPLYATLYEEPDQDLRVQLWPVPSAAGTIDALRSTMPATLTTDASVIPFDEQGLEATACEAAAVLAGSASPDVLSQLALAGNAPSMFRALGSESERASRERRANLTKTVRDPRRMRRW